MNIENRLKELGLVVPEVNNPLAAYVPGVKSDGYVYISGQLPMKDGKILYSGKLGADMTVEDGQSAARLCAINCLAVLKSLAVDWENVIRIVKITGFVQSTANFYEQPRVINGASELIELVFGEIGRHARSAVGVVSLPLNAACEIEMIVRIK